MKTPLIFLLPLLVVACVHAETSLDQNPRDVRSNYATPIKFKPVITCNGIAYELRALLDTDEGFAIFSTNRGELKIRWKEIPDGIASQFNVDFDRIMKAKPRAPQRQRIALKMKVIELHPRGAIVLCTNWLCSDGDAKPPSENQLFLVTEYPGLNNIADGETFSGWLIPEGPMRISSETLGDRTLRKYRFAEEFRTQGR